MKKITLILSLLISAYSFAQNISTGQVALTSGYTVQFDVDGTTSVVTMTMILPENDWLAVALDATGMGSTNKDVVVYDSSGLQDRYLNGQVTPPTDGASDQDWTQSSNTVTSGVRTVVATRDLNTSDAKDYVFTTTNNTAFQCFGLKALVLLVTMVVVLQIKEVLLLRLVLQRLPYCQNLMCIQIQLT